MKLEAIPITHVDIHGKTIHYIKITNGVNVRFVHVVERVYNAVKELETEDVTGIPELPFDENTGTKYIDDFVKPKFDEKKNNEGTQSDVQTGNTQEKSGEQERLEGIRPVRGPRNGRTDK